MRRYCERCQNTQATLTLHWTVRVRVEDDAGVYFKALRESLRVCDACLLVELADHHRDEPRVEAL